MRVSEIISSVVSGAALLLLAAITRALVGVRRDFRRFMTEHLWLLATTMWTRDKVIKMLQLLGMEDASNPPADLPPRH